MKNLCVFFLASLAFCLCGQVTIDNRTAVRLEIANPTPAELNAAKELKHYMGMIFGTPENVLNRKNGPAVILRYDKSLGREEFKISSDKSGNVIIRGGRARGVLYGAYYFLDRKLGVHWYSPYDEYVPTAKRIAVKGLPHHGKPTFVARLMLRKTDKRCRH